MLSVQKYLIHKTQLILKGIISIEEWEDMKEHIQFDYIADNYFTELKEIEIRNERLNEVNQMDPYVGKYFSAEYIRRQVLKQTDTEIAEIDKQIEQEIADGTIMDPADVQAMELGMMPGAEGEMGADPAAAGGTPDPKSAIDPADLKRGEF